MSETLALTGSLPSHIRPGEVLGGKYRLESEIGHGSMGTVWSAVHLTLGQRVAIKLILSEHAQEPQARARFRTEAKAVARLKSRFVVQVYDDGETPEGTPYIVLEYLSGETLEQRLLREHTLPLNDAVRIARHVGRGLSRAHAQGIVHRDLKPGNVFLVRSEDDEYGWIAKVLDFGIAKLEEQHGPASTRVGMLVGTPLFMSPEQAEGTGAIDRRTDLYSLGMLFYNMVTGELGFSGQSFADVLIAICTQPLPRLQTRAPWIPTSVSEWFEKSCARSPSQRFSSADEMLEALDLALGVSGGLPRGERVSDEYSPKMTLRGHGEPAPAAPVVGGYGMSGTLRLPEAPRFAPPVEPEPTPAPRDSAALRDSARARRPRWALTLGVCALGVALLGAAAWIAIGGLPRPRPSTPAPAARVEPSVAPAASAAASPPATPDLRPAAPSGASDSERNAPSVIPATTERAPSIAKPRPQERTTEFAPKPVQAAPVPPHGDAPTRAHPTPAPTPDMGF